MPASAKICGLSTPEAVDAAIAGGASHVGLVFFPPSPRNVGAEQARSLVRDLPPRVKSVGVFVDPDDELLDAAVFTGRIVAIQLHGREAPMRVAAIRKRYGIEVWKAVPVQVRADLAGVATYRGAADRILYDARTPDGALPGGIGLRFDWRLLDGFAHPLPWALSGGLDAGNVAGAIGVTGARLVDASSGCESAPGVKDVDKIAGFCQAVARS